MTTTITVIGNQKGGVGKTSTTCNLAAALVSMGRRVLTLDLDPQANTTATLDAAGEYTMYDVLRSDETGVIAEAIVETAWPGVNAVPGTRQLALFEQESIMTPEHRLKNAMWDAAGLDQFDDILIDTPPSLGRLTLNGLIVADRVVILTELESYSLSGVGEFVQTLTAIRRNPQLNPPLRLAGIIVNKARLNTVEHQEGLQELKAAFGTDVVKSPYMRASTVVPASASAHKPVSVMRGASAAAIAADFARHAQWLVEEVA